MAVIKTTQSGIKKNTSNMENYSLFMGGLNTTNAALAQYAPLKTGYSRLFITRLPYFMTKIMESEGKRIKHLMEYAFIGVDGIQNTSVEFGQLNGGYNGSGFDVAIGAKDETNEITVKIYDFQGSPVREYMEMWASGIFDYRTGLGHYHGCCYKDTYNKVILGKEDGDPWVNALEHSPSNHTMEAIYVVTGPTGGSEDIEYACLLTNMMPKSVKKDHLNYTAGQHDIVETDLPFTTVKYESAQISSIAKRLIQRFGILRDYLDADSGYTNTKTGLSTGTSINESNKINDWTANGNIIAEKEKD